MSAFSSAGGPAVLDSQGLHVHFHLTIPPQFTEALMGARPLRLWAEPPDETPHPAAVPAPPAEVDAKRTQDVASCAQFDHRAAVQAALASLAPTQHALSADEIVEARRLSLHECYQRFLVAFRRRLKLSEFTHRDDNDRCRQFDRWDRATPPEAWDAAAHGPWTYTPIADLTIWRLWQFLRSKLIAGDWSRATAESRFGQIQAVLGTAAEVGILSAVPAFPREHPFDALLSDAVPPREDDEEDGPNAYSIPELGRMYATIPRVVDEAIAAGEFPGRLHRNRAARMLIALEMQTAIVLAVTVGARPRDWSRFRFDVQLKLDGSPPRCVYVAKKTERHAVERWRVPLGRPAVAHLRRLRAELGLIGGLEGDAFPHIARQKCKNPLSGRDYKRATAILKAAMRYADIDASKFPKPWHALRKTHISRMEAWGEATGRGPQYRSIYTHKDQSTAAKNYSDRWDDRVAEMGLIDAEPAGVFWPAEILAAAEELGRD